ncbi:MAG TPA: four helix bundle protein [Niabella sp.]|nr:four helix bundle protein [Niabella sp.]HOZ96228.1 four helix bundle protein [Niabella sp.]HQW13593.1 four helix bundle protein [Niabella sp.]HQX18987.1 four helix bundle protein [Niabella sp.]HQX40492.1 four helix bundle protein [Niabella sp.]
MNSIELQERLKMFAYRIVPLCEALPPKNVAKVIESQQLRSAFSSAANYRTVYKGQSSRSITSKLSIAFEKIDESLICLEVISDLTLLKEGLLKDVVKEADELARILAASKEKRTNKKYLFFNFK